GVVVICPHFAPDNAPTGTVMTRIVGELVALGHRVHVVTALPWYRTHSIEEGWTGSWIRREDTPWGSITRVHPFPGDDKSNLVRRAVGFIGYSVLAGIQGLRAGGWFRRAEAVIAMSPPLTLGLTGRVVATMRRAPLVFNIQDVFPDAAIETGAITNRYVIGAARWLERVSYRSADAVTVLSSDLGDNVRAKLPARRADRVHEIPNFVDTEAIAPLDRLTSYRSELALGEGPVVLYGGNVGFSQSLELVLGAARALPDVQFLVNGDGAARTSLEASATDLPNVTFRGYIAPDLLGELLATGDIHVVPLKAGLGRVSVPSKTYSIMAAGRPVLAAIDPDTAVPRILQESGGGVAVVPDDLDAFVAALVEMLADPDGTAAMGRRGRAWAVANASPAAVGRAYSELVADLVSPRAVPRAQQRG
ncbi:MAG: glycosyltransferase family 4 protein, partial [Ilumatobacter sp.]|uniref:glycosyltransferase family 4 protein n=2 Tax=Ilumatobacter sp. TaxID=1967498 RepID=UPI003298AEF8